MMNVKLQLLGGGKMGEALIGGLISAGWASQDELRVAEAVPDRRTELVAKFPDLQVAQGALSETDTLLAVKPQDVKSALSPELKIPRLLSIAAGVRIDKLTALCGEDCRVLRAMPNTPALVGEGASAVSAGPSASAQDLAWATEILESVGTVVVVEENLLDAVTGVSGSGPAYLFLLAEHMISAAVKAGLAPETADTLVRQTLLGSATLLSKQPAATQQTDTPQPDTPQLATPRLAPAELRQNVTSPGGTTEVAIEVLMSHNLEETFHEAIQAAIARSEELAQS